MVWQNDAFISLALSKKWVIKTDKKISHPAGNTFIISRRSFTSWNLGFLHFAFCAVFISHYNWKFVRWTLLRLNPNLISLNTRRSIIITDMRFLGWIIFRFNGNLISPNTRRSQCLIWTGMKFRSWAPT